MEKVVPECGNCDVDLESGEGVVDSKISDGRLAGGFNDSNLLLSDACYELGNCDGSMQCEARVTIRLANDYSDVSLENVKLLVDRKASAGEKNECNFEKKSVKEKPKAMSAKKPPKPPRPPRGLSLDSTDQKIIRELAEMAKLKRARMERMKALKKMKEARTSSSKNQLFATLFTILFCLVILFQGISSRSNSAATFQGSPMTSRATDGGIIPMTHYQNLPASGYKSPSLLEQVSELVSKTQEVGRVAD